MAFVKLPNFLSVETKPFDLATYEDEFEEDEVMDDEGRSRLKLRVWKKLESLRSAMSPGRRHHQNYNTRMNAKYFMRSSKCLNMF